MIALEHVCDDDRKRDHSIEIRENNDNYNNDGGGEGEVLLATTMLIW